MKGAIHVVWLACLALVLVYMHMTPPTCELVVSRYAEDLSWLKQSAFRKCEITVYDKNDRGDASHGNPPARARVVRLPNVGREGHTYLHHIVHNYTRLADVTVFVMGSARSEASKGEKLDWVMNHVTETGSSAFPDIALTEPLHVGQRDFSLDEYASTTPSNARANPVHELDPSPHRPFGRWYAALGLPPIHGVTYQGVFAVSRKHVHQRSPAEYARLMSHVAHHANPEAGHFLERSWMAVFHPVPRSSRRSQRDTR